MRSVCGESLQLAPLLLSFWAENLQQMQFLIGKQTYVLFFNTVQIFKNWKGKILDVVHKVILWEIIPWLDYFWYYGIIDINVYKMVLTGLLSFKLP